LLAAQIESAMAAGTFEVGLETIRAESLAVVHRTTIATHGASSAETRLFEVARKDRNRPLTLDEALELARGPGGALLANTQSRRAAVQVPAASLTLDDGSIERRVRLIRPMERPRMSPSRRSPKLTGKRPTLSRSPNSGRARLGPCRNSRRAGFMS
jgi:hypothetical protein